MTDMTWHDVALQEKRSADRTRQVDRDYRRKLLLERDLAADVDKLWKDTARAYTRRLLRDGTIIDLDAEFGDRLQNTLAGHYEATGEVFRGRIGALLPAELAPTPEEIAQIDDALAWGFRERAASQSELINSTTHRQMDEAFTAARRESHRLAALGTLRSLEEEAVEAGNTLGRRLQGRTAGIASLETQAPAEIAKLTEVEVLCGHQPSVMGGAYVERDVLKTWWTKGDDIVREDHLMADQQEQQLSQPYIVGGDMLMAPGDTSLGAPIAQVINCRCASVVDETAVAEARTARGLAA